MKIRELRKLPFRERKKEGKYDSLLIINSGKKHDSGYAWMYVIGVDENNEPIEIAAACDDINWLVPFSSKYKANIRTDMYFPSGVIRMWSREFLFCVGESLSSVDIELIKK